MLLLPDPCSICHISVLIKETLQKKGRDLISSTASYNNLKLYISDILQLLWFYNVNKAAKAKQHLANHFLFIK